MRHYIFISLLLTGMGPFAHAEEVYKVAVRAISGIDAATKQWAPTLDYLSKTIPGYRFEILPHPQLAQQLEDARLAKFQFLLTNPATFVEVQHMTGGKPLVTLINKRNNSAQTHFGSVIFTRSDQSNITKLSDLKDKHLIAVSPLAFGGWRVAWREMLSSGFDPYSELEKLSFAHGNQPDVVQAVHDGKADAGVVRTDMLERLAAKGSINLTNFRILHNRDTADFPFFHSTPLYPEWPFAVMPGVSDEVTRQVKRALLNIQHTDAAARHGKYIGWTDSLNYQAVIELLKELQVGPYKREDATRINFHLIYPMGILILLFIIFWAARDSKSKPETSN